MTAYALACGSAVFLLGLLFYRSVLGALICLLSVFFFKKYYVAFLREKRVRTLLSGFRDVLYSFSASFAAGCQMPRAVERAAEEMAAAYGAESDIAVEMRFIAENYESSHADLSMLLESFGKRSGIPEIAQFAQVYSTCESCGADIEQVCMKSAGLLLDRLSFQSEVRNLISQKKTDIILLSVMPVAVLLFLNAASFDYIRVLYETAAGRIIMTGCLAGIGAALVWGLKITEIEI